MVKAIIRGLFLSIIIIYVFAPRLAAQDDSLIKRQVWAMGLFNWKINDKWVFNEDISFQQVLTSPNFTRIFTRSQINYQINGTYSLHGGLILSYIIDQANGDLLELTPWIGAKLRWPSFGRVNVVHYLRAEERNRIELDGEANWTNVVRLRYRLGTDIPINHASITDHTVYGIVAYEYYSNESGTTETFMIPATHRFDIGIGYSPDYRARYEVLAVFFDTRNLETDHFELSSTVLFLRWRQNFNWR